MNRRFSPIEHVLFVFAHQDDEYAILSRINYEMSLGHQVHCVYLTDGVNSRANASRRNEESRLVLSRLGVPSQNIAFLGDLYSIPDRRLVNHLEEGLNMLARHMQNIAISRIFCLSWEGGHPDHDASHLIALAFARKRKLLDNTWEFSIYHGHRVPRPWFRALSLLNTGMERQVRKLTWIEGLRFAFACWQYPSQWKTWIGLFPECFFKLSLLRREVIQCIDPDRILQRPHEGPLFYEWKFAISYEKFAKNARSFIQKNVMDHEYEIPQTASHCR